VPEFVLYRSARNHVAQQHSEIFRRLEKAAWLQWCVIWCDALKVLALQLTCKRPQVRVQVRPSDNSSIAIRLS